MGPITPAQAKVIQTWTEKRDGLLREIGIYETQLNELKKKTKDEGLALADLHIQISETRGRIAELSALEIRHKDSVSIEVSELEVRKSRLEGECLLLEEKKNGAVEKYQIVTAAAEALEAAHVRMKDQAAIVDSVVGGIIETSQTHISDMKVMMAEIKTVSDGVIERGNKNIAQTGIILEKLPRYIFELQKPIPVRRTYAVPRGTQILPPKEAGPSS